jgi:hypothetical protein
MSEKKIRKSAETMVENRAMKSETLKNAFNKYIIQYDKENEGLTSKNLNRLMNKEISNHYVDKYIYSYEITNLSVNTCIELDALIDSMFLDGVNKQRLSNTFYFKYKELIREKSLNYIYLKSEFEDLFQLMNKPTEYLINNYYRKLNDVKYDLAQFYSIGTIIDNYKNMVFEEIMINIGNFINQLFIQLEDEHQVNLWFRPERTYEIKKQENFNVDSFIF